MPTSSIGLAKSNSVHTKDATIATATMRGTSTPSSVHRACGPSSSWSAQMQCEELRDLIPRNRVLATAIV